MSDITLPDLTFPQLQYGKFEIPWDLKPLLYQGGAGTKRKIVGNKINDGLLGVPIIERLSLVIKMHEYVEGKLAGGGPRGSSDTSITRLREFFSWADKTDRLMTVEAVQQTYIDWTEYLLYQGRVAKNISEIHAYQCAVAVATILDDVLELRFNLLSKTRMRRPKHSKTILGTNADKQNLEQTFSFGHALLDITDAVTENSVLGNMPVTIRFRTGQVLHEWLKLSPPEQVKTLDEKLKPSVRRAAMAKREKFQSDTSFRTRGPLINLRIEAEILIFISQTGINLEQACTLKLSKFRYRSHLDGYEVFRVYKGRRHGEVAFTIFDEYRKCFERYLSWRAKFFSDEEDELIFPFVRSGRADGRRPSFGMVKKYCNHLAICFVPARNLRKTRINWFLRRSKDPAMTAEMHAHAEETLIRVYEQPSLQVAMIEITRFHARNDPALASPGPGLCIEVSPQPILNTPPGFTTPDCISPAGCLFCVHQRDIDSQDHVWSLASYRYLKSLELAQYRPPVKSSEPHPAASAAARVTAKLKDFEQSSELRQLWVREAMARVEEGYHHPRWEGFIHLMEAQSWP